jgi:hypothetical protein
VRGIIRLAAPILLVILPVVTAGQWMPLIGRSLVCDETDDAAADAIIIENFDPNYLLFERTRELLRAGRSRRVLVPTRAGSDGLPASVESGFVEVMVRVARMPVPEMVPIQEVEPISLHAAEQVRAALGREPVKSVLVVTSALRSRRTSLIYHQVFERAGIAVSCVPVFGEVGASNWLYTWHGVQEVAEQFAKLEYYRFYVLPRLR